MESILSHKQYKHHRHLRLPLLADAKRWKQLKLLDEYLAALLAAKEHTPEFLKWLVWAKQLRQSADPLRRSSES